MKLCDKKLKRVHMGNQCVCASKKYLVTKVPDNNGLYQVLIYDSEIQDYRTMAFEVILQDAKLIVKALRKLEKDKNGN